MHQSSGQLRVTCAWWR